MKCHPISSLLCVYDLVVSTGHAPDNVYQAGVAGAADYWQRKGAVRGVQVGFSISAGKLKDSDGAIRGNFSGGVSLTVDKGLSASVQAGMNLRVPGVSGNFPVAGLSNSFNGEGWKTKGGPSFTFGESGLDPRIGIKGDANGHDADLTLGFSFGRFFNAGIVVDPSMIAGNLKDTYTVLTGGRVE